MDDADRAQELDAFYMSLRINAARERAKPSRQPKGSCHYCGEPFDQNDPRVFCDHECAGEFELFGLS